MYTIQIDFTRRLFTICGDGEPVIAFKRYRRALALLADVRSTQV